MKPSSCCLTGLHLVSGMSLLCLNLSHSVLTNSFPFRPAFVVPRFCKRSCWHGSCLPQVMLHATTKLCSWNTVWPTPHLYLWLWWHQLCRIPLSISLLPHLVLNYLHHPKQWCSHFGAFFFSRYSELPKKKKKKTQLSNPHSRMSPPSPTVAQGKDTVATLIEPAPDFPWNLV